MKTCSSTILAVVLAFVFAGCDNLGEPLSSQEVTGPSEVGKTSWGQRGWERQVQAMADRFVAAIRNKDIDAFMECWWNSPNTLLVLENGFVVQGYDNIRAGAQGMFDAHETVNLVVDEVTRFRLGDEVYAVGTATWTRTLKPEYGGVTTVFVERWTDVARKIDGKWVYVVDHAHDLTPFAP